MICKSSKPTVKVPIPINNYAIRVGGCWGGGSPFIRATPLCYNGCDHDGHRQSSLVKLALIKGQQKLDKQRILHQVSGVIASGHPGDRHTRGTVSIYRIHVTDRPSWR